MKIKLESAELPETEVIIRGDVTSEEVVNLLQLLKKRSGGKLILYKEEEQYIMDADEIVYVEVSDLIGSDATVPVDHIAAVYDIGSHLRGQTDGNGLRQIQLRHRLADGIPPALTADF